MPSGNTGPPPAPYVFPSVHPTPCAQIGVSVTCDSERARSRRSGQCCLEAASSVGAIASARLGPSLRFPAAENGRERSQCMNRTASLRIDIVQRA